MPTRARGRHFAPPAPRSRPRRARNTSSTVTSKLPLTLGLGLAVTMVTTGFAAASGTPLPLIDAAADGAEPVVDPNGSGQTPGPILAAGTTSAAASVAARDGAASRSGERAPAASSRDGERAAAAPSDVVVPADATMSDGGQSDARIKPAPPPPVLPGCDGGASGEGSNGDLPLDEMCVLWDDGPSIRADAAVALAKLNKKYRATFGEDMCITDGYRSYGQQVATKAAKGYLAAMPGTSNHGWGLAVDLCPETYDGDRFAWLLANAPEFGWDNPPWARYNGSKYEPWHWEFTAAVEAQKAR